VEVSDPAVARELASFHRSDAVWVVSSRERQWLVERWGLPAEKVLLSRWGVRSLENVPDFHARSGFCSIGNFRHEPNLDAARFLLDQLWPEIRARLPGAELHLYGAYPPRDLVARAGRDGVKTVGSVPEALTALARHRVLLAPLRFGAGIKGKVLDAWASGTAAVGSSLAVEGMLPDPDARAGGVWLEAGTVSAWTPEFARALAEQAVSAHEDPVHWADLVKDGAARLVGEYSEAAAGTQVLADLRELTETMAARRSRDFTGALLWQQGLQATRYLAKYIELKEQLRAVPSSSPESAPLPDPSGPSPR
jgi:glycosyltransferase involved in cell wall biosynthesis